jgi:hypothetical protein
MNNEIANKEKMKDPLSGDIVLYHYNWSQLNEYIINNAQQARFGAAGDRRVSKRKRD